MKFEHLIFQLRNHDGIKSTIRHVWWNSAILKLNKVLPFQIERNSTIKKYDEIPSFKIWMLFDH